MSDLSDRPDLPEDLTAPPVRRAPDALRHRIDRELRATQSRTIGPRHVIAPIAAVGLLVAGLLGAAQINTQQDVVPAQSPSDAKTSTPTAATSKVGTPSPSPSAPSSAPSSADPNAALAYATLSCADVQPHPTPTIKHPASDSAGVDRCRNLAAQCLDSGHSGSINLKKATARVTVSTKGEWGAVLSDGKHYVGCSLFPTEEISSIRRVTPGTGVAAFGWATNPINPHGDSLWAAGYLPGATKISYGLPDGSTVDAKISSSGYWMVKTHTAEAFDTEEYTADWAKIKISVTRSGSTTTYSIPWTEKTMCNQVSHGC